jgi:hypothetical protein
MAKQVRVKKKDIVPIIKKLINGEVEFEKIGNLIN